MSLSSKLKEHINNVPINLNWCDLQGIKYFACGGQSVIYTAFYNKVPVIIKTIKPDVRDIDMVVHEIEQEMVILSKLNHPNIVQLYGAGHNLQGYRFLVLECLYRGSMDHMISAHKEKKRNRITYTKIKNKLWTRNSLSYARAIASALEYCHSGIDEYIILHRDLKPDNIGNFFLLTL